jgi:hypothetical protein
LSEKEIRDWVMRPLVKLNPSPAQVSQQQITIDTHTQLQEEHEQNGLIV